MNVTGDAINQANGADTTITAILASAAGVPLKGSIDSRYLWPTMVFERVCSCKGNYYGANCNDCMFGWTGTDCNTRKPLVTRQSFSSLSPSKKQQVADGIEILKNEMGYWSVVVSEPTSMDGPTDRVTLQDVSTYDYLVYIHNFAARDASTACNALNGGINVDFAHAGPCFPVWHRTFLLILERAMQRVLRDESFGFPYWNWESGDMSPFMDYFGSRSDKVNQNEIRNVSGGILDNWRTVCDYTYQRGRDLYFDDNNNKSCSDYWRLCNPQMDLANNTRLERGNAERYLPSLREVRMAIAAPDYDRPNSAGAYQRDSPRESFRSRLEGWNMICSASNCVGPQVTNTFQRLHNNIHDWVNGHMAVAPSSVNDPIFSLHHTNVDRILESWMQRFDQSLPEYVPVSGGHSGHNRDDFMVPFFPLITPGEQYSVARNWGYRYDNLIAATIMDKDLSTCNFNTTNIAECYLCTADSSECSCFQGGKYVPCTQCPAEDKQRCSSGPSSNIQGANHLLYSLIALFSIMSASY